jgi:RHS repeat-associated protein
MDNSSLKIQYNRNRYYDYYTGRFTTHDPLGYFDGTNLYEYVKSNPVIGFDPYGFARWLDGKPDVYLYWKYFKGPFIGRSQRDKKCRKYWYHKATGTLGTLKTPFGHDIGDPIMELWESPHLPSAIKDWVERIWKTSSLHGVCHLWTVKAHFYRETVGVSNCPETCDCLSRCCVYYLESSRYALGYLWYDSGTPYEEEITLPTKKELMKRLKDDLLNIFGKLKRTWKKGL